MPAERLLQQDTSNLSLLLCSPAPQDMILPFSTRLLAKKLLPRNHCLWFHLGSPSYWRCVPSAREVRRRQASCGCSWDLQENLKSLENALVVEPRWPCSPLLMGVRPSLALPWMLRLHKYFGDTEYRKSDHRTGFSSSHIFSFFKTLGRWKGSSSDFQNAEAFNWKEQIFNKDNCLSFSVSKASLAPKIIIAVRTCLPLY